MVYAAVQVSTGQQPRIGPLELAILAGLGMAWARRSRWRSRIPEAAGLPLLALLGGAIGWFLDPTVRGLLVDGFPRAALGLHVPGWLAGIAVLRGGSHASREDDEDVQERLLRYAIPSLAVPWLVGTLAAPAHLRAPFTTVAFLSTMLFAGTAFASLGLARLEAVGASAGTDGKSQSRSWLTVMAAVGVATALLGLPAAWLMGVPLASLATLIFGPIRLLLLIAILLSAPLFLLIAAATEALRPFLPSALSLPSFSVRGIVGDPVTATSPWATIVVITVVLLLAAVELAFLGFVLYLRRQERLRMAAVAEGFEERSIVRPPPEAHLPSPPAPSRRPRDASDPVGAYLAALDILERDGRWPRRASETPAMHAVRVSEGPPGPSFARLTAAYELVRYGGRTLSAFEAGRARPRLARLRRVIAGR